MRGADPVNRDALAAMIQNVSQLIADFPEIAEMDLNPVFASQGRRDRGRRPDRRQFLAGAGALPPEARGHRARHEPHHEAEGGRRHRRLLGGGQDRQLGDEEPDQRRLPRARSTRSTRPPTRSWGCKAYKSVKDVPGDIDVAVFAIPAKFVAAAVAECGEKKIPGAVLIPSGFAETGNVEGQKELVEVARKYGVRLMGPNIYGFYYTWSNLCATFCTAYDVKGNAALSSQSGGIGMAIIGFSRSAKMGVSAIVGLGNKADIDEDDLLTFFEQDDNTQIIVQHCEDLKDGRAFAEVARRVSKKKPVVVLKAGRTAMGARAASSHTGALAGNDKIYDDVLKQSGVIRARSLREMLEFARAIPDPADAEGRKHRDHHRGRRLRRAAVRRGGRQRAVADGLAARTSMRRSRSSSRRSARPATRSTSPAASRRRPTRTRSGSGSRIRGSTR